MSALGTVAAVILGLLLVSLCAVLGVRHARRSRAQLEEVVRGYAATLRALSERTGLRLELPAPYAHPLLGAVPAWPSLAGPLAGLDARLETVSDGGDSPVTVRTQLRLRGSRPLRVPERATFRLPRDEAKLRALTAHAAPIAGVAERLELTASEVVLIARPAASPPRAAGYELRLALDADALARLIELGVALATELAA